MSEGAAVVGPDRSRVVLDPRFPATPDDPAVDGATLIADVFRDGAGRLVLVGDPRLGALAASGAVAEAGTGVLCRWTPLGASSGRTVVWAADAPPSCHAVQVTIGQRVAVRPVQPWLGGLFAGRRVLFAANPGRSPARIATWARFHVVHHGVDAVLLAHRAEGDSRDVAAALAAVPGIALVAVAPWNDVVQPAETGSEPGWLANAMLEQARRRLLDRAAWLAATPVDDLLVPVGRRTLDDWADDRESAPWMRPGSRWRGAHAPSGPAWVAVPSRCPDDVIFGPDGIAGAPGDTATGEFVLARSPEPGAASEALDPVVRGPLAEALAGWEPRAEAWSAAGSGNPDRIRAEALRLADAGEPERALEVLQEAIRRDPWHPAQAELRRDLLQAVARRAAGSGR